MAESIGADGVWMSAGRPPSPVPRRPTPVCVAVSGSVEGRWLSRASSGCWCDGGVACGREPVDLRAAGGSRVGVG